MSTAVRRGQNFSLWPVQAAVGTLMPATYMRGSRETFGLYPNEMNFPRWGGGVPGWSVEGPGPSHPLPTLPCFLYNHVNHPTTPIGPWPPPSLPRRWATGQLTRLTSQLSSLLHGPAPLHLHLTATPPAPTRPRSFTAWLGNFSSSNKQRRLLGELSTSLAASGHLAGSGRGAVRLEYASALRTLLTKPLAAEGEGGIAPTVELMHDYCIDK